jgi:hypothetical protein
MVLPLRKSPKIFAMVIPDYSTIWDSHRSILCTSPPFCNRMRAILQLRCAVLSISHSSSLIPRLQHFSRKLKEHLLPRIQAALLQEAASLPEHPVHPIPTNLGSSAGVNGSACDSVFFKKDCMYHHKLLRFHFTTYDVRRGTDIINSGTSRCNIMLLADHDDGSATSPNPHQFLYARVLGAYHANVIYTGPGMRDYEARRFDFLWVRWFEVVDPSSSGWASSKLDAVRFPPMHRTHSFGFVDPKDVLRGCHILPSFAKGKRQTNGVGISRCAKDGKDYNLYYVGRYGQQ